MDEDIVFGILLFIFFFACLTLPLSITACLAASATRKWSKEKARYAQTGVEEADPLVKDSESEDEEILDSEDEEYYNAKREQKRREREEKLADWQLSTRAKFGKEWKKCWCGPAGNKDQLAREKELKEQEDRKKIAREAVREYIRGERRKARKTERAGEMELPSYKKVVAEGKE